MRLTSVWGTEAPADGDHDHSEDHRDEADEGKELTSCVGVGLVCGVRSVDEEGETDADDGESEVHGLSIARGCRYRSRVSAALR